MIEPLLDRFGEPAILWGAGALVGLVFGVAAARSRFCLRAATVEIAETRAGPKLAIWLVAFCAALVLVQGAVWLGRFDPSQARQLAATGSLSGALIGGLMFGAGMILARGCASRLLVLSASGNLRAIVTGLVLTLTAQAALRGVLAPLREALAALWTVPGGPNRNLAALLGLDQGLVAGLSAVAMLAALAYGLWRRVPLAELLAAAGVGVAVFLGWWLTYAIAALSFDIVAVQSVTFTGPSTDTLMGLVNSRDLPLSFGFGLVPGVFLGAALVAVLRGDARIQRFGADTPMERYLIGAMLMGFGSMLAGGCAVGAGMTGGSVLALTAWLALGAMWAGAVLTHRLMLSAPGRAALRG